MTDPRTQATRTQLDTGGIGRAAPTGWAAFVGIMLVIVGTFNAIWGLTALFNDEALTVGEQGLIVWDFTAWGWIHLIIGIVMILAGLGLFRGAGWARWIGRRLRDCERDRPDRVDEHVSALVGAHHYARLHHHLPAGRELGEGAGVLAHTRWEGQARPRAN